MNNVKKKKVRETAKNIVISTMGEENDYIIRLLTKYIGGDYQQRIVNEEYRQIGDELDRKINNLKDDIEGQRSVQMVINAILKEKLADRSELIKLKKDKFILSILTIVLPCLTTIIQFIITQYA